jgi:hypothetical protein
MSIARLFRRLAGLVLLLLIAAPAFAVDTNATLKGVVTDAEGLPVPSAEVLVESPNYLGGANLLTDEEGRYRFITLPPGVYSLRIIHPSFAPWESGPLKIALGSTVVIDVTLASRGTGETITVISAAPAIDVESTHTGVVLDAEFLKDIPTGGDYQSAIEMAPGVVDLGSGNPNSHGGFDSSNQFYIDGVNTTDPMTNTFSMNMNFDAIESIEVLTGGMDAEYGRALGGAFNIVTKSGGNEFEGTASLFYSDSAMVVAPLLEGDSADTFLAESANFNLGGPILKDKIWFFGSVEARRSVRATSVDPEIVRDLDRFPMQPRDYRSIYLFGKITAQPSPEHRISLHAQADPTSIDNVIQDPYTLPSGEAIQNQGGWILSIGHQYTPSQRLLLESQLYYQTSTIDRISVLWEDCTNFDDQGGCTDDFTGTTYLGEPVTGSWFGWDADDFSAGERAFSSINRRYRVSATSALTYYFDALGEHEAKFGVQGELLTTSTVYPGLDEGYYYYTNAGDPNDLNGYTPVLKTVYDSNLQAKLTGTILSWYVQDVYQPVPRLTLRPGVRFDAPTLQNDVGDVVIQRLTAAPRFGVAYDLTGDGKTSAHAFYGRFYDTGFLGIADILNKGESGYSDYYWDEEAGDWSDTPSTGTSGTFLAHDDLRNPYSDEYNIGLSRQVGDGWGLDATFIYERSQNFWEDDEVNLIWNEDGTGVIGYRNGVNEAIYRLRTPDDTYTTYTSLETVLRRSFSDRFGVLASYAWSRSYGTNSYDQASYVHDIPQQYQYEIGLLDYDIPHNVKLAGSYTNPEVYRIGKLTGGYTLGWNTFAQSGLTYRPIVENSFYGGANNFIDTGNGRYRLPMLARTDVRVALDFVYKKTTDLMIGANCFNVFNDRTITEVNTEYIPDATGDEQPFGEIFDRLDARRFELFARGEF